jgi:hypothetical protein
LFPQVGAIQDIISYFYLVQVDDLRHYFSPIPDGSMSNHAGKLSTRQFDEFNSLQSRIVQGGVSGLFDFPPDLFGNPPATLQTPRYALIKYVQMRPAAKTTSNRGKAQMICFL